MTMRGQASIRTAQFIAALNDELTRLSRQVQRLRGVRYCGLQEGRVLLNDDQGATQSSILLMPDETVGEALDRLDQRFREER